MSCQQQTEYLLGIFSLSCVLNMHEVNGVRVMVFNATFHNITVVSWRLVLLVGETGFYSFLQLCNFFASFFIARTQY